MTDRDSRPGTSPHPRTALVLSGGGARGAFDAGVVAAVHESGIRPDVLAGTSAGALTAATVAMGWSDDRIEDFWTSLHTHDVYRPRMDLHHLLRPSKLLVGPRAVLGLGRHTTTEWLLDMLGWTWLFHLRPLRRRLVEAIGGEVLPLVDGVTLVVSAVEVETGELVRFSNHHAPERDDGGLRVVELTVDHLLASAAIPGLFEPVQVDGVDHWDGGLASNTPLSAALQHDPDRALVVASSVPGSQPRPPASIGDVLALAVEHVFRSAVLGDLDHARTVNQLTEALSAAGADTKHRRVELVAITPDEPVDGIGELLDFHPERAARFHAAGLRAGRAALG